MNKQELIEKINGLDELALNQHYLTWLVEQLDEPQPPRLKDIIARMEGLSSHVRSEWLDDILYKFGHDYGTLKYKAGYEQGKVEGLIEREKVTIPKFVADWYEEHKDNLEYNIWDWMKYNLEPKKRENVIFSRWLGKTANNPVETLIKMKLYGYEVKKEKRYLVKMKGMNEDFEVLKLDKIRDSWYLGNDTEYSYTKTAHTRKELEDAGFGWVFDCPGVEIEEVEG